MKNSVYVWYTELQFVSAPTNVRISYSLPPTLPQPPLPPFSFSPYLQNPLFKDCRQNGVVTDRGR